MSDFLQNSQKNGRKSFTKNSMNVMETLRYDIFHVPICLE